MTYEDQLRMNAIVSNLTAEDDDSFDPEDAKSLRDMLAPEHHRKVDVIVKKTSTGSAFEGHTSTGHNVSMPGQEETKTYVDTRPKGIWCGKRIIHRFADRSCEWLEIKDRFLDTRLDGEDGGPVDHWRISFSRSGEPDGMERAFISPFPFTIPFVGRVNIQRIRFQAWKSVRKSA